MRIRLNGSFGEQSFLEKFNHLTSARVNSFIYVPNDHLSTKSWLLNAFNSLWGSSHDNKLENIIIKSWHQSKNGYFCAKKQQIQWRHFSGCVITSKQMPNLKSEKKKTLNWFLLQFVYRFKPSSHKNEQILIFMSFTSCWHNTNHGSSRECCLFELIEE